MDSSPSSPIAADKTNVGRGTAMSDDDIEQRLKAVSVYSFADPEDNLLKVKDKNLVEPKVFYYFNEEDAKTVLGKLQSIQPGVVSDYEVAPFALSDVLKLMADDSLYGFVPESKQILNAVKRRRWAGFKDDSFSGVPVFKPEFLVVRSKDNKIYRPVYFRLEDLHRSIAISTGNTFQWPVLEVGYFQVADLEEVIRKMKDDSNTDWDDVMFIPPGYDLSVDFPADQSSDKPPPMQVYRRRKRKRSEPSPSLS